MKNFLFALILLPTFAQAINHSDSIPYPFYSEDHSGETQMMPLHRAEESFQLRLELVQKAQKSIDVEYYIYEVDMASKIFTRELVKAAERGVKVRILIDKFISHVDTFVAHELAQKGIELRYYNTNVLLKLGSINYRNHRKLLVIDGAEAITGGRNMGDDYYNMSERYNFDDRDVYVKGPLVTVMKDSFEEFYKNKITHASKRSSRPAPAYQQKGPPDYSQQKAWDRKVKKAQEFLAESEEELHVRERFEDVGNKQLAENNIYPCPVATFVTDVPGATADKTGDGYKDNFRNVRKTFLDKILPVDKELTMSSPYFIPNDRNEFIFEEILKKNIPVTLYTNSLRSTDSIMMSASLYMHLNGYLKKGMQVYFNDGNFSELHETALDFIPKTKFGTHSKTHVYETSTYSEVMIGSYNIDNRSDYYNTEIAVFCKGNDDFSKNVKGDIMNLAHKGLKVTSLTSAEDRNGQKINITGSSPIRRLKMTLLSFPSWLFGYLL